MTRSEVACKSTSGNASKTLPGFRIYRHLTPDLPICLVPPQLSWANGVSIEPKCRRQYCLSLWAQYIRTCTQLHEHFWEPSSYSRCLTRLRPCTHLNLSPDNRPSIKTAFCYFLLVPLDQAPQTQRPQQDRCPNTPGGEYLSVLPPISSGLAKEGADLQIRSNLYNLDGSHVHLPKLSQLLVATIKGNGLSFLELLCQRASSVHIPCKSATTCQEVHPKNLNQQKSVCLGNMLSTKNLLVILHSAMIV